MREKELKESCKKLEISKEIMDFDGLSLEMIEKLGQNSIKTLDDLGDLASDELVEIVGEKALSVEQANEIIMRARSHWFE